MVSTNLRGEEVAGSTDVGVGGEIIEFPGFDPGRHTSGVHGAVTTGLRASRLETPAFTNSLIHAINYSPTAMSRDQSIAVFVALTSDVYYDHIQS